MMDKRTLLDRVAATSDERLLLSRVLDRYEQCAQRNLPTHTEFLSPAEQAAARRLLSAAGIHAGFVFCGGYETAERRMLAFLPDWCEEFDESEAIAALRCIFRAEEAPTHRDFLGSLMGMQITRERVGDILVGEESADVLLDAALAPHLLESWTSAGRTALKVNVVPLDALRIPEQKVKLIRDTVATLRLDAVTAVGFSMSRAKASELIAAGRVQKNYRDALKGDASVSQGDVISARGLGKFELSEVGGLSKKGRTGIVIRRCL